MANTHYCMFFQNKFLKKKMVYSFWGCCMYINTSIHFPLIICQPRLCVLFLQVHLSLGKMFFFVYFFFLLCFIDQLLTSSHSVGTQLLLHGWSNVFLVHLMATGWWVQSLLSALLLTKFHAVQWSYTQDMSKFVSG